MRGRTTLILLGILALLATYVYLVEIKGKSRKEKTEEKAKKLLVFDSKDIQKVTVKRASDPFSCEKNGEDDWRLLSPVEDRADKSMLSALVTGLTDLKADREDVDVNSFSDFGLDPPLFTVVVGSTNGKNDTLFLGEKNPTGTYVYARKPREKRLILTNSSVETHLTKPLFDLRDKSVLAFEKETVEGIRVESQGKSIALAKTGNVWNLTDPVKTRADENTVDSFLNQFRWAQAKEYVDEKPKSLAPYGLSRPGMMLTLTLGVNKSQNILWIGDPKGKDRYYAKDAGRLSVFLVDTALVREFKKTVSDFRDKKIVRFETDSIKSIAVEYPDRPSLICRKDTAEHWLVESPKKARAIDFKINTILYDVRDMQARDFLGEMPSGLGAYGLDKPKVKALFKNKAGAVVVELLVGREAGKSLAYVMNAKTKSVFKVDDAFVKNIKPNIDDIVEKEEVKEQAPKSAEVKNPPKKSNK